MKNIHKFLTLFILSTFIIGVYNNDSNRNEEEEEFTPNIDFAEEEEEKPDYIPQEEINYLQ
jgi:hypothetical protein